MKRKILTIVLSCVMVFSMSVPSFAGIRRQATFHNPQLLVLGDSICTGYKGGNDGETEAVKQLIDFDNITYERNWDVKSVEDSFVTMFAKKINACDSYFKDCKGNVKVPNRRSWHGGALGTRAKDYCYFLGLPAMNSKDKKAFQLWSDYYVAARNDIEGDEAEYEDSLSDLTDMWGTMMNLWILGDLKNQINVNEYKKAIRNADVIVVELGNNEFSSFMANDISSLISSIEAAIKTVTKEENLTALGGYKTLLNTLIDLSKNPAQLLTAEGYQKLFNAIAAAQKAGCTLTEMGLSIQKLLDQITETLTRVVATYRYYTDTLMSYIDKNKKPGAVVICTSITNPIGGITLKDVKDMFDSSLPAGISLPEIEPSTILQPFVNDMNRYMKKNAIKNHYYIADVSKLSLWPRTEEGKLDGAYGLHPNKAGHELICNALYEKYKKVVPAYKRTHLF